MPDEPQPNQPLSGTNIPATTPVGVAPSVGLPPQPPQKSKKRWFMPILIGVLMIVFLAGLVFAVYLPNTPEGIYQSSLRNSGTALDKLISYSEQQQKKDYKSTAIDGTVKVKSPEGSYDVSLKGAFDKKSHGTLSVSADVVGEKLGGELRSVPVAGESTPDVYLRLNGSKSLFKNYGLDKVNNQWVSVDHTLIDTLVRNLKSSSDSRPQSSGPPSYDQIIDALTKMQKVNKEYLFTTNKDKAVLANEKFVGHEKQNGHTVNHYQVGYNKAHLQAYVAALKSALDSSKLNDWTTKAYGQNLSEAVNTKSLQDDIKNAKGDYKFDMWVDTDTKLISKLDFMSPSNHSHFTVSQGYAGGSKYPVTLYTNEKDESGTPNDLTVTFTLDTNTNSVEGKVDDVLKGKNGTTTTNADFTILPSQSDVKVSAPANAKSINDVLREFGLSGLLSGESTPTASLPSVSL